MNIDDYVTDVLLRDLVGHDRAPSAFLVYLHLWARTAGMRKRIVSASHRTISDATGLSKSAVQSGIRHLLRRRLLQAERDSPTAVPRYQVMRPWIRR